MAVRGVVLLNVGVMLVGGYTFLLRSLLPEDKPSNILILSLMLIVIQFVYIILDYR